MNIASVGGSAAVDPSNASTVIMAQKALSQQKLDGQNALTLIQGAAAPGRGTRVSVLA
jgi:hypothetical protein